jgi:condensin complex subunit 1
MLERVAVLSLCKYMCCSEVFCSENLNKLFALLGTKTDPITKTNIIISLGDLIHRYPNITEPYTQALY